MPEKEIAVSVKDIHKEFTLPQSKNSTFKQTVVNIVKNNNKVTQKTLDGVSFDIHKGDFFGIVGRNGSGKSTLLKLIAGVYTPTAGSIEVNGGLTPFIELGVGFNPELSGRDNIFLNGALLGYSRKQMDSMYDEIVAFAELENFMEQKLKNYSSGMQVRLAFSIAIKAKNDILIFDEVLAVGDEAFQRKCLDVFDNYKRLNQTVILVTHDMDTVKKYCNRAILLRDGKVVKEGDPRIVADEYSLLNETSLGNEMRARKKDEVEVKAHLEMDGVDRETFSIGETVVLHVSWPQGQQVFSVMTDLFKLSGEHVSGFNTAREDVVVTGNEMSVELDLNLTPGKYFLVIETRDEKEKPIETSYRAVEFMISKKWPQGKPTWSGLMPIPHRWKIDD